MRKYVRFLVLLIGFGALPITSRGQIYELERLILDIEKLVQLKSVLTNLYKDYEVLETGYSAIKNISEGNFNLHKVFLDGLLAVSPTVRKYERVVDIVDDQAKIVSEYKAALAIYKRNRHFTPDEITYISNVFDNLVRKTERNLTNLLNVMTAKKLRMNDAERLQAIDRIYADTHGQLTFLRQFNAHTTQVGLERKNRDNNLGSIRSLFDGE